MALLLLFASNTESSRLLPERRAVISGAIATLRMTGHRHKLGHKEQAQGEAGAQTQGHRYEGEQRILLMVDNQGDRRRDDAQHDDIVHRHARQPRVGHASQLHVARLVGKQKAEHQEKPLPAEVQACSRQTEKQGKYSTGSVYWEAF